LWPKALFVAEPETSSHSKHAIFIYHQHQTLWKHFVANLISQINHTHLTFLASNIDHRIMLEVFHTGQIQLCCLMKSLSFFFVFGDVCKLSFAIMKGGTNSLLAEKQTKWPQMRRQTVLKGNISQCQSKFFLPHTKFQDFNEKLLPVESLHKKKLQLSSGPICSILCCDNIKSVNRTSCICPFPGCYSVYSLFTTKTQLQEEAHTLFQRRRKKQTS